MNDTQEKQGGSEARNLSPPSISIWHLSRIINQPQQVKNLEHILSQDTKLLIAHHTMKLFPVSFVLIACIASLVRGERFPELRQQVSKFVLPHQKRKSPVLNISRGGAQKNNEQVQEEGGKATIVTSVFNLANNVAGAGILTLAAGKATGTGWVPSILTCVALAFCSAHTFILIGKACELTGEKTFKGLWSQAFGKQTAWIVDSMVFTQCFFVSIIYTGLLGDIFSALLESSSLPTSFTSRTSIILIAATCILWPLNTIRDLSALGFTSILGLVAVLYTVFFIVVRALDGTYSLDPIGKFVAEGIITPPSFDKSTLWNFDLNSLVLVSNLGLAFIAHYNGPSYWQSLSRASSARFSKVALSAYAILATIYTITMVAGYATFGDVCQGTKNL